jgi:hypothetical protein
VDSFRDQPATLGYATPGPTTGSGLAAGVWITIAGLGLVILGGCFCIGVMVSLNSGYFTGAQSAPAPVSLPTGLTVFISVLYLLAIACFAAAACVLVLGLRKLLSIGRS